VPVSDPAAEPETAVESAAVVAVSAVEPLIVAPPAEPFPPEPAPEPEPEPPAPEPPPEPPFPEPPPPEPPLPDPLPEPLPPDAAPLLLLPPPVGDVQETGAAAAAQPAIAAAVPTPTPTAWWLISVFTPAPEDAIDWTRGAYSLLARSGRIDSLHGSGQLKKTIRMVEEGSLLFAAAAPRGTAADVAPDGFPHPVFRAGYAVALPVPFRGHS
jgi:hypothetical protein